MKAKKKTKSSRIQMQTNEKQIIIRASTHNDIDMNFSVHNVEWNQNFHLSAIAVACHNLDNVSCCRCKQANRTTWLSYVEWMCTLREHTHTHKPSTDIYTLTHSNVVSRSLLISTDTSVRFTSNCACVWVSIRMCVCVCVSFQPAPQNK